MMGNQSVESADQAQAILGAWGSGNIKLFCEELNRVGSCAAEPAESEELERMELLRAIAADLRVPSIQPLANDPGNIYSSLLRHLAFSHRMLSGNSFSEGTEECGRMPSTGRMARKSRAHGTAVVVQ